MPARISRAFPSLALAAVLLAAAAGGPLDALPEASTEEKALSAITLSARAAILIDQATGRVLYARDADAPLVPASLAKLMCLHIVYEKLADRSIRRDDVVSLSANAWAANQAPGSSVMNLGPGQIVTVAELMKGVAIASGNDAAAALAEYVAGSADRFVRMMNDEARFLGYARTLFTDPAGVRGDNRTTAREFADFCRRYIEAHPEALGELHSLREFDYPLPRNLPGGSLPDRLMKKQFNGNFLVWDDFGVDGLKTGHLDDENFTAAFTAKRGGTRLVAVLLGVPGRTLAEGARRRSEDGMALLSSGFRNYSTVELDPPRLAPVRVWKGAVREAPVAAEGPVRLTVSKGEMQALMYTVEIPRAVIAPVARGQRVGRIVYFAEGAEVGRVDLVATGDVGGAGLLRSIWDSVLLGLSGAGKGAITVRKNPVPEEPLDTAPQAALSSPSSSEEGKGG